MSSPVITLLSDFGLQDHYVAVMKGVILRICPAARLVDISHLIAPGDLRAAAFLLYASYQHFPPATIHLAVVDPGVGTARKPIAIHLGSRFFVGPDNGLFSLVLKNQTRWEARELQNARLRQNPVSPTFHGRDIFAPAAAHLARGVGFHTLGALCDPVPISWGEPLLGKDTVSGEVIHVDRFGNAVTNVTIEVLEKKAPAKDWAVLAGKSTVALRNTYGEVQAGQALALAGSTGFVEIAVNRGSAASQLELHAGTRIVFRLANLAASPD